MGCVRLTWRGVLRPLNLARKAKSNQKEDVTLSFADKSATSILSYPRLEVELDRNCAMALVARQRVVLKSVDHHAAWTEAEL